MAPSSRIDREELQAAVKKIEALGYKIYIHPQTYAEYGQSAGTAQEKADALHELYKNPEIKAIVAAGGGNRAGWLLEKLDFDLIRKHPKILMGYSDVTALLSAITKKAGQITFHGPVAVRFGKPFGDEAQLKQCFNLLQGKADADMPLSGANVLAKGEASGHLVCGDELSHTDRMFSQLRNAGVFDKISGLVLGGFTAPKDTGRRPFGLSLTDIVNEAIAGKNIPAAITDAPFGHDKDLYTLPLGHWATLRTTGKPTLRLDGLAVAL